MNFCVYLRYHNFFTWTTSCPTPKDKSKNCVLHHVYKPHYYLKHCYHRISGRNASGVEFFYSSYIYTNTDIDTGLI